jgi:hypothetical protein
MPPKIEIENIVGMIFLEHKFEFPITVVMIGIRGYLVAKWELATASGKNKVTAKFENIVVAGKAKDLRFPINTMLVDSTGKAAHFCIKRPNEIGSLTFLPIESEVPSIPWPKNWPKA